MSLLDIDNNPPFRLRDVVLHQPAILVAGFEGDYKCYDSSSSWCLSLLIAKHAPPDDDIKVTMSQMEYHHYNKQANTVMVTAVVELQPDIFTAKESEQQVLAAAVAEDKKSEPVKGLRRRADVMSKLKSQPERKKSWEAVATG